MDTIFIGKNIIRLKEVDSTNNYAANLLRPGGIAHENSEENEKNRTPEKKREEPDFRVFDGTVVTAEFQKKGKGQRGNEWESEKGKNLTFSIILTPRFLKPHRQFFLNQVISLGIRDFLESKGIRPVSIKWPNDIFVADKKIAGILIENSIRAGEIIHSVIGIGMNINQQDFLSAPRATSMRIVSGKMFRRDKCLCQLCSFIEGRYLKFRNDPASADAEYTAALYQINEWKNYLVSERPVKAKITGTTPGGMLVLVDENGLEINCGLKEIVF